MAENGLLFLYHFSQKGPKKWFLARLPLKIPFRETQTAMAYIHWLATLGSQEYKEYLSWHCAFDGTTGTIVWHEDKRGKAADNGDLDLAAAMWQQYGSSLWPADSRKWWLSARWQGNSSETSAPHFLFLCKVRKEAEEALTCGECRCR